MPIEPGELVTIPNITLVEAGTWMASTGEVTFTQEHLASAVAAIDDPMVKYPRLRFGHTDPTATPTQSTGGFDSQPCVGKFVNLRLENDGNAIVADLVGVPKWLGGPRQMGDNPNGPSVLSVAYPSRSVEAYFDVTLANGKKYPMIMTACAVLGEEQPAVQTLEDLEVLFSAEGPDWADQVQAVGQMVHASRKEDAMPTRVAASVDTGDVRSEFYAQVAVDDRYWWWITQMYIDPSCVIADDENGDYWFVSWSVEDNSVVFDEPVQADIQWVEKDTGKVLASQGAGGTTPLAFGRPVIQFASADESRPPERRRNNTQAEETNSMNIEIPALRTALGLSETDLPDDATEEAVNEAIANATPSAPPDGGGGENDIGAVTVPEGQVLVDAEAWRETQASLKGLLEKDAESEKATQRSKVQAAIQARKIPKSREAHYVTLMEKDPVGTAALLESLQANAVPGEPIGSDSNDDAAVNGRRTARGTGLFPELERRRAMGAI